MFWTLIFTNEEGMIAAIGHAPGLGKSDHESLFFDVRCNKLPENKKPLACNIFKGDYVAIKNHLKDITWNEILKEI